MSTIGGEAPLLPEGPPPAPRADPIDRGIVNGFLLALGYDPQWVVAVKITPREVVVDVVSGELYPIMISRRHEFATPEPIPEPGPRR